MMPEDTESGPVPAEDAEREQAEASREPAAAAEDAEVVEAGADEAESAGAEPGGEAEEAAPAAEMDVSVEDAGVLRKKVTITVPTARIDAKREEMFGELSDTAQVPGFRIGRAPRRLIEKRFGKAVAEDIRNALVGESFRDFAEQAKLKVVGEPDLELEAIELPTSGPLVFSFEVEVAPEFELPKLEGIPVERREVEVTDELVEAHIRTLLEGRAKFERTDGAAAAGDSVTVAARIAGEGIEPVERPGLTLRVAPGQIEGLPLVDLGEALAGRKAGETASLSMVVSDSHPNEAWRGKTLTVEMTLTEVRRRVVPKLDDEMIEQMGLDSEAEMRQSVRMRLAGYVRMESRRFLHAQARQYLLANTALDLPPGVAKRHADRALQRRHVEMLQQGMPRERIDEEMTRLQADVTEEAEQGLKLAFILSKIAEERQISVTEDEVNAGVASLASVYNRRPERLRHELEADGMVLELATRMVEEKVLDQLLSTADFGGGQGEAAAPADAGAGADGESEAAVEAGGPQDAE